MSDPNINLAEQALDNLVNQFARPLDFLRELVQNSIDAGSPRIEVRIEYDPPKPGQALGVTRIHVDGSGGEVELLLAAAACNGEEGERQGTTRCTHARTPG